MIKYFCILLIVISSITSAIAQAIRGPVKCETGIHDIYIYESNFWQSTTWQITGGIILSAFTQDQKAYCTVRWTEGGTQTIRHLQYMGAWQSLQVQVTMVNDVVMYQYDEWGNRIKRYTLRVQANATNPLARRMDKERSPYTSATKDSLVTDQFAEPDYKQEQQHEQILKNIPVYPIPTTGMLTVETIGHRNVKTTLTDMRGQVLQQKNDANGGTIEYNLHLLPAAMYILVVQTQDTVQEWIITKQ